MIPTFDPAALDLGDSAGVRTGGGNVIGESLGGREGGGELCLCDKTLTSSF